ncbi:MAG: hypothetical protein BWK73_42425 [Thiothrix lacustris]|uniref:DUF3106 domain-containing protein n=1 Tax=Thiothrix lacustris TaxID=525917 RepID=A0A1Y1QCE4_9GAMM|nr:MAG: hypothetical protein BWK73_42425 [Thiothrix lacustris]
MNHSSNKGRFIGLLMVLLATLLLLLPSSRVMAGTAKWEDLNSNEKAVLKDFQQGWETLPDKTQSSLRRWAAKPATERTRIKQRFSEWQQLSDPLQKKLAKQLARYRAMSSEQKARIKQWHEWVKKLPEAERNKLREEWHKMNDTERRSYMKVLQKQYGNH